MRTRDVAVLASKILGVYAVIKALLSVEGSAGQIICLYRAGCSVGLASALPGAAQVILLLLGGTFLWTYAEAVADRMTAGTRTEATVASAVGADELQVVAFTLAGVFVIASAVPALISNTGYAVYLMRIADETSGAGGADAGQWLRVGATVIRVGIGLWLLLGASGIAKVLHRLREGPPSRPETLPDDEFTVPD